MKWLSPRKKELTRREIVSMRRRDMESTEASAKASNTLPRNRQFNSRTTLGGDSVSERQELWNLKKRRRKAGLALFGFVSASLLILGLLTQLSANISVQSTVPVDSSNQSRYIDILDNYLGGRPLERLRFAVDQTALHEYFLEHASEVKTIRLVSGGGLASTKMQLTFRQPVVEWSSGGKQYFVDEKGITFGKSYFAEPGVAIDDQSGIPSQPGQEVVNQRFLGFLGQAVAMFTDSGHQVSGVILPADTVRQVEFRLEGKRYAIKMVVDRAVEAQVNQAKKAIQFMDANGLNPSYVDVRVDQRVFYR